MVELGKQNSLKPVRDSASGCYLDGGELGEILLPKKFMTEELRQAESISVFVYKDSEDRLVATTETPKAMVGQFATLEVLSANPKVGAFLDWGLSKDLLLPFREHKSDPMEGDYCVVYILVDELSGRIIASERLTEFVDQEPSAYESEEEVDLLVIDETPLGYKAIINDKHLGLLYHSDLSEPLEYGQWIVGYVSQVREDGKIDLRRDRSGYKRLEPIAEQILEALNANEGVLPFNDKSSPESIRAEFDVSKQAFKRAIGTLYKQKRIRIKEDGIVLSDTTG
ncbi:GntR family transcriptional regulator [Opitutia bacterium ISCC 51]|nr:GntR family transcriptional regulator [Opitutae bacterium ISCC 51]QXD29185.1 GntR family transcriptional regulator [Opitutae bacterium ISCC 52]